MSLTAITDLGTMLFIKEADSDENYKYLVPIKTAPATGSAPSQIDITELDSKSIQNTLDRQQTPAYDFSYNYTIDNFTRVQTYLDGKTNKDFLIIFQDKSGFAFSGIGATWTDSISAGNVINGMISIAVDSKEWISDVTTIVDETTIPSDKYNPFVDGNQILMGIIGDQTVAAGSNTTVDVSVSPLDSTIAAVSGDIANASVSISGNEITITGVAEGQAIVTVTATKDDWVTASKYFVVNVTGT